MNQVDIIRIEKKVDLLYKILIELEASETFEHSIDEENFFYKFINELIPLFNLSAEKEIIKVPNQDDKDVREFKEIDDIDICKEIDDFNKEIHALRLFQGLRRNLGLRDYHKYFRLKPYLTQFVDLAKLKNILLKEGIKVSFRD